MAVTVTNKTGSSTTSASSATTASITPTANALVLAAIWNTKSGTATTPTLSGNGLTWVQITQQTVTDATRLCTIFRAMGGSPSAGAVTIDFGGVTQTWIKWQIFECTGDVSTSGTNGSGAVIQNQVGSLGPIVSGTTTLTITLSTFGQTTNIGIGAFMRDTNGTMTLGSGCTEIGSNSGNNTIPVRGLAEFTAANDPTVDCTWSASNNSMAGIALEVGLPGTPAGWGPLLGPDRNRLVRAA